MEMEMETETQTQAQTQAQTQTQTQTQTEMGYLHQTSPSLRPHQPRDGLCICDPELLHLRFRIMRPEIHSLAADADGQRTTPSEVMYLVVIPLQPSPAQPGLNAICSSTLSTCKT